MNLFDIVPSNYFSLFGGKNRYIYAESLLILFDLLQNDEALINKNDFLKALKDKESKNLEKFDFIDEDLEDNTDDTEILVATPTGKASFIIRRLEETGWINIAMDPDTFEETVVLPAYSILFLRAIHDVISDEEAPYLSLVHSTYSELKLEDEEPDELLYATLLRSYENTKKLKVELITLVHSIRIFQNKLGKVFQTNDVLHDYFDVYKTKISDRYYHPLKTFDSVAKFKRPIIRILEKWLTDKDVREKMIMQAAVLSHVENKNKIEQDIIEKINYISDTYENLGGLISSIDKENSSYTKSSTNKILYLNNNDRSIKGYLENIFKLYVKATNNPRNLGTILSQMQNSIYFYEQGYIDSDSVTLPILRKFKYDSTPLEVVDFDAASEFVMDNFLRETNNIYTDERIYGFMQKAFGSSDTLEIKDIPLIDYDAFICLILATVMKDDENCFYTIENIDDTKIRNHNFIVPNLIFHKKEEN